MDKDTWYTVEPTHARVHQCFNFYCIYQKGVYCQLPAIVLNDQGVCRSCKMLLPEDNDPVLQYRKDQAQKK